MKPTEPSSARRRLLPVAAIVLVLGGLLAVQRAFPEGQGEASTDARPLPVAVVRPEPVESYAREREFTGEVRARRRVDLGFEVAGRVLEIAVEEGDRVETGADLARVDTRRLLAERLRLTAARKEAEAVLAEMRAGPRPEIVDAARAAITDLDAQVDLLERKADRRKQLLAQKTISDEEYDEIRSQLVSLRARQLGAKVKLSEFVNGTRSEIIDAQTARIEGLDAQIARLDLDVEDGVLRAPFAGRVLRRHADEGAVATPGAPILTLVEDGVLEAWIGVPPSASVGIETSASYVVRVGRRVFEAQVEAKLPGTDPATRTQTVILRLPADADGLVPGQIARLAYNEQVPTVGFWVPLSALTRGVRGLWALYALEPGNGEGAWRAVRHAVEVLHAHDGRALVRGTLDADTQIVVGNAEKLAPGQSVRPTPPDA